MSAARYLSWRWWPDTLRWGGCFMLVLGMHAAAVAALLGHWHEQAKTPTSAPAILVDLAPVPVAPAVMHTEVAPGPQQRQAASEIHAKQPLALKRDDHKTDNLVDHADTIPLPPVQLPALREVVMPPPRPIEKTTEDKPRQRRAHLAKAPSAAERQAAHAAALAPGTVEPNSNALPNWKSALVARLESYKRYPDEARARGDHGVAQLAFSVDRSGGVHHARILRSSGSSLLDRATLALVARAQPLPPPPPEVRGAQITVVVPIRYNIR
jgi:protein TonB